MYVCIYRYIYIYIYIYVVHITYTIYNILCTSLHRSAAASLSAAAIAYTTTFM